MEKTVKIPLVYSLQEIHDNKDNQIEDEHIPKYMLLARRFEEVYGEKPDFFTRAPGKVTLVGDHGLENGYPAISAAIEQDVIIAFKQTTELYLEIHHFIENFYKHLKIQLSADVKPLESSGDEWANQFIIPFKHALKTFSAKPAKGIQVVLFSTLPENAGLGYESAVGLAAELVAAFIYCGPTGEFPYEKLVLESDSAVIFNSAKDSVVEINPPAAATRVKFVEGASLVVANSLAPMPKLLTVGMRQYKRIVECKLGLRMLELATGLVKSGNERKFDNISLLQKHLGYTFEQMVEAINKYIKKEPYNEFDIKSALGCPLSEVVNDVPNYKVVLSSNTEYYLYNRLNHILSEANRVAKFKEFTEKRDMISLGQLMDESHKSSRELYDSSVEEVEELWGICKASGALGAKMTGPGWGGCVISLVDSAKVPEFVKNVEKERAAKLWMTEEVSECLFTSKVGTGAVLFDPSKCLWY